MTDRSKVCGPCTFCCKVMSIEELNKPMGVRCPHQVAGKGCSIYGQHPPSCQAFACQWLLEPAMPHRFRPDLTKVVLDADSEGQRLIARCDPANPLAWRREPIYSLLKEQAAVTWGSEISVVAKAGLRLWFIAPRADIDLGEVSERAPLSIIKARDGTATVRVLPDIPDAESVEDHLARLNARAP